MAKVELILPKMGESVSEATIITWTKEVGEMIDIDDTIIEVATDKVDSEVPSTHKGKLIEQLFNTDDIVKVGQAFAILETDDKESDTEDYNEDSETSINNNSKAQDINEPKKIEVTSNIHNNKISSTDRFYSPLVKSIALKEGIELKELESIQGSGKNGRVTKLDITKYIESRNTTSKQKIEPVQSATENKALEETKTSIVNTGETEIIEMDRMRKLISSHMTMSKKTSAHITSFVEADMTNIVNWRNKVKKQFIEREKQNITFTPIIIEAMAKAVKDFPLINVSVDETNIHIHKNVNIGMAAALPDGNLIVPVIKNADQLNLVGMAKSVNDLASRARSNNLTPDDVAGGTYTVTNVGVFGSIMGTPIINQPQVGILAFGAIRKMPSVIETEEGDYIGIRKKMIISHSYDHRVVNGALGSKFIKAVKDYLENWNSNREI